MDITNYLANGTRFVLGKQGEYGKPLSFDFSCWHQQFGEGSVGWAIQRSQDTSAYLLPDTEDGTISTVVLTETETQYPGIGLLEVFFVNEGQTQKRISLTAKFEVLESLQNLGVVPEPWEAYVDAVHADAVAAEEAKEAIENMSATASIDDTFGTPTVVVEKTTIDDHENLDFAFAGLRGNGITDIELILVDGLQKTYRITMNEGHFDFVVSDGNGISAISKTGTSGLVDTYTITYTNGNTFTYTVTNGNGISRIEKTATSGLDDTYTITFTNGTTTTYTVHNGNGISSTVLNADYTLTISYTNGTSYTTPSIRGEKGETGDVNFATFDVDVNTGILWYSWSYDNDDISFLVNDETGELEVSIA